MCEYAFCFNIPGCGRTGTYKVGAFAHFNIGAIPAKSPYHSLSEVIFDMRNSKFEALITDVGQIR
ncbi:hypothetical protein BC937DRAFT_95025 [Endogone sp. FLAS-F59071]|nr:hypothetical protein BC937DRAFT_95025 [Endogone sp. FLAS-F59071]|eukprot:RUS20517.1 hypothetical protein BC937DRAFT_95025 [Endogone sp. FLAS-F59071]